MEGVNTLYLIGFYRMESKEGGCALVWDCYDPETTFSPASFRTNKVGSAHVQLNPE